jgi:tetratricopeptide (TPR) repeat protein
MSFLGHKPTDNDLRFSAAESFRLCTLGLRSLEQYEDETEPELLQKAEDDLSLCVELYPADVLPKFYLGSVKTLKGYDGIEEAKLLFNQVIQLGGPALSFAAKYNLAVANVEEYSPEGFSEAEKLLGELISSKPKSKDSEKMVWSAQATLLYVRADRLWQTRNSPTDAGCRDAAQLLKDLDTFEGKLNASRFREDREVWSDEWNNRGTLQEFLFYASKDPAQKVAAASAAKTAFQRAADLKVDYVNSMSNFARLTHEVLGDRVEARRIWEGLFKLGKSTHYIHYNLGKLDEEDGNSESACNHYRIAAPRIDKAQAALDRLNCPKLST